MESKAYVSPDGEDVPIPIGGVDLNPQQPGQQLFQPLPPPSFQQPGQPQQTPEGQSGMPGPTQGQPPVGGMLSMTPQGQAMDAMSNGDQAQGQPPQNQPPFQPPQQPQQLAKGGKVKAKGGNKPVIIHKNMDTIKLELSKKKAKK